MYTNCIRFARGCLTYMFNAHSLCSWLLKLLFVILGSAGEDARKEGMVEGASKNSDDGDSKNYECWVGTDGIKEKIQTGTLRTNVFKCEN